MSADTEGSEYCGYLWVPDWSSLSGFEEWLVYNGSFDSEEDARLFSCRLMWEYSDICSILVSFDCTGRSSP